MQQTPITQMELLTQKAQLQLAQEGLELLEKKRAALMRKLMRVVDVVAQEADYLDQTLQRARLAMARAEIEVGAEAVQSAAIASISELPLKIDHARMMGVDIVTFEQPQVVRAVIGRGYAITNTSTTIDEAALAFETAIEAIIQQAENELRLTRLVQEIQRTMRRLNVLDHILIPRIQRQIQYIQNALNEQVRSDDFRFRLTKRLLQRRRAGRAVQPKLSALD